MSEPIHGDLDLARAFAEGRVPESQRQQVASRLRADPEFAALVALYGAVRADTEEAVPPRVARPAPDFADAPAAPRLLRPLALAAAAAVLLALGVLAFRDGAKPAKPPQPVFLRSIPLDPVPVAEAAMPPAADLRELARYSPNDGAGVRLVDGVDRGLALSRASTKPLLVFLYSPQCPVCLEISKGALLDDAVGAAAEPFVVARQDVASAPKHLLEGLRFFPAFAVYGPEGERESLFAATTKVAELVQQMGAEARAQEVAHGPSLPWDAVHGLARDLAAAEDEAAPARRLAIWERVAKEDPEGALGAAARARALTMKSDARGALLAAKNAPDPQAAKAVLDDALARLAGTPYEADLRAVRVRLDETGTFPPLEPSR
jgi:hypothetical protein